MATALLTIVPAADATYPGHNGKLAYEMSEANGSVEEFDGISSIPQASAANCQAEPSFPDVGTNCTIGRINFSPGGARMVAARQGVQGQLEVLDSTGKNVTVLSPLTSDDEEPAFLPGGRTIVFTGTASHHQNLYEANVEGTGVRQLTHQGGEWAAPCANGMVAFVNRGGLYIMRANGTHLRRLVRRNVSTPDCAPNSRSIVYSGVAADFTVRTNGGKPKRIRGAYGSYPVFSPDGTRVAYTDEAVDQAQNEGTFLVTVKRNGHRVYRTEVGDGVATGAGAIAWQPRG